MSEFDDLFDVHPVEKDDPDAQPFDKEEWAQQKKQERENAYRTIDRTADEMTGNGELFQQALNVMARFDRYSVGNVLLVTAQRPDAKRLADAKTWMEHDIHILKGSVGVVVLTPGNEYTKDDGTVGTSFVTKKLFDVSQTNSKQKKLLQVKVDDRLLLKALLSDPPCAVEINDEMRFPDNVSALYMPEDKKIYVKRGMDAPTAFRNLARELCFAKLDKSDSYSRSDNMFTVQAATYILCKRNGMDTSDFSFETMPASIVGLKAHEMTAKLNEIRDTANSISFSMNRFMEKQQDMKSRDTGAR